MTMRRSLLAAALLTVPAATPAHTEKLILSLSNHRVLVTSSFTGVDLVLFGTIEPDAPRQALRASYDIAVTVAGPQGTVRTRRKDRVLGVWINTDARQFVDVPTYLAVLANKPFPDIANADTLRRQQVGLDNYVLKQRLAAPSGGVVLGDTAPDEPFRAAFVRLETHANVYRENPNGVTFLTPTVFRAAVPLPATAPTGNYTVDVKVFSGGQPIVRGTSALEVVKAGFEQYVASAARDHGLLYGLATALMALMTGWLASVVFRRD